MKNQDINVNEIAQRAKVLAVTMPVGEAADLACREAGVPADELAATRAVVAAMVDTAAMEPPRSAAPSAPEHPWAEARRAHARGDTWPRRMWPAGWRPGL